MKSVAEAQVTGKRVIVRVDWNVTLGKTLKVIDDTRIRKTLPTIEYLLSAGAQQIVLISHLGKAEEKRSIAPVAAYAEKLIGQPITLIATPAEKQKNKIVMLENVRLFPGEDRNDASFAQTLAALGDIYVDEAFGEAHRESASIVGVAKLLPAFAGLWFVQEVETILKVRNAAAHPFVVVMGGAKVADKLQLLQILSQRADTLLIGGKLANEFQIQDIKLTGNAKIVLPLEGSDLLDIGPTTQKLFAEEIAQAKTVVWNGPMGKVEDQSYRKGTEAVYEALTANTTAFTLVGGGDTLAAITQEKHLDRIDFVSTGGGAMLKLLENGTLPGIEAISANPSIKLRTSQQIS